MVIILPVTPPYRWDSSRNSADTGRRPLVISSAAFRQKQKSIKIACIWLPYYFPGRVTWNEVSLSLVDPISVDAVQLTNSLIEGANYHVPSNIPASEGDFSTMSKAAATGELGQVIITILDASGKNIEQWTLNNAFLKSAKYGDLDYSNDDLRSVELTIRYDWATCDSQGDIAFQ